MNKINIIRIYNFYPKTFFPHFIYFFEIYKIDFQKWYHDCTSLFDKTFERQKRDLSRRLLFPPLLLISTFYRDLNWQNVNQFSDKKNGSIVLLQYFQECRRGEQEIRFCDTISHCALCCSTRYPYTSLRIKRGDT